MATIGPAICGLVTSVLTAVLVVFLSQQLNTEIFTWSLWMIIPIGAILTGAAACSGYYFGSKFFNCRPNNFLLIQAVVVAGLTQLLIYFLDYVRLGYSDRMLFQEYLNSTLTQSQYTIGHFSSDSGFTVGWFGYVLAGLQFAGFLLGGGAVCALLFTQPYCDKCTKYFNLLGTRQFKFSNLQDTITFFEQLAANAAQESKCLTQLGAHQAIKPGADAAGTHKLHLALHSCASCNKQLITSHLDVFDGKAWTEQFKTPASSAKIEVPLGANLNSSFVKRSE